MNGGVEPAGEVRRRRGRLKPEGPPEEPAVLRDRISRRTALRTRRGVTFLLGLWCGGMLLTALLAPASFRSVDWVLRFSPAAVETLVHEAGAEVTREALRYQAGEVNRLLFTIWGWMQAAASAVVLLLLLFLSDAKRLTVGVAALMATLAAVMNFVLIPRIASLTRTPPETAGSTETFAMLHTGFAVFQAAVLVLIVALLFLLFRGGRAGGNVA